MGGLGVEVCVRKLVSVRWEGGHENPKGPSRDAGSDAAPRPPSQSLLSIQDVVKATSSKKPSWFPSLPFEIIQHFVVLLCTECQETLLWPPSLPSVHSSTPPPLHGALRVCAWGPV